MNSKKVRRREFIKMATACAAVTTITLKSGGRAIKESARWLDNGQVVAGTQASPAHPGDSPHRWAMVIDLDKCTGCSNCVRACPTDVIRMDPESGLAVISYPENCQICHLCRLSCPVDAITLTPEKAVSPMVSWA